MSYRRSRRGQPAAPRPLASASRFTVAALVARRELPVGLEHGDERFDHLAVELRADVLDQFLHRALRPSYGDLYGRPIVIDWNASITARMRAPIGISSPFRPMGYPLPSQRSW